MRQRTGNRGGQSRCPFPRPPLLAWTSAIPPFAGRRLGQLRESGCPDPDDAGVQLPAGGATLLVDGDIPAAAGMSSSSALVVASALALLGLTGQSMDATALADLLARGEQYVGTLSGGMDQATIMLGRAGYALRHRLRSAAGRGRSRFPKMRPSSWRTLARRRRSPVRLVGSTTNGSWNAAWRVRCSAGGSASSCRTWGALDDPIGILRCAGRSAARRRGAARRSHGATWSGARGRRATRARPSVTLADRTRFVLRARVRHVLGEAARVAAGGGRSGARRRRDTWARCWTSPMPAPRGTTAPARRPPTPWCAWGAGRRRARRPVDGCGVRRQRAAPDASARPGARCARGPGPGILSR